MKAEIRGPCLCGGYSRLEIEKGNGFELNMFEDLLGPTSITLNVDNIAIKNCLFPHLRPPNRVGVPTERLGFWQNRRLQKGSFVSIGQRPQLDLVEHLFSALYGLNLFDVRINVYGSEIPFFDGSSQDFVALLRPIQGHADVDVVQLNKELVIRNGKSFIAYEPLEDDQLIVEMELSHPYIATQKMTLDISEGNYVKEIAPARTFVFTNEEDPRLKDLPPYGIGVTKDKTYSLEPLRFSDELVRHKILDMLGDLFVLKRRLAGKILCKNTSHHLNLEFVRNLVHIKDLQ